jgi:O-antigen/teichoic acid export membrane protein
MSLVKSYGFKLLKTSLNALMAAFIWPFIASTGSAANYGDFGYLQNAYLRIFTVLEQFISALYPRVASNKAESHNDQVFSLIASTIFSATVLAGTFFLFKSSLSEKIFFDISIRLIILVFVFCYCQVQSKIIIGIADSLGITWKLEPVCIGFLLALFSATLYLFYLNKLNLENFLTASIIANILTILYGIFLIRNFMIENQLVSQKKIDRKKLFVVYLQYSGPMYFATVIGILLSVLERYFVQVFNGPAAQGYLTLILNISLIISMISAVMTPFILRTVAEGYFENNKSASRSQVIQWFDCSLVFFLQISTFICVWFGLNIDRVIELLGWELNEEFKLAFWLVMMASTVRVVNQFCSSSLLGAGEVKSFAICSVSAEAVSLMVVLIGLVLVPAIESWVVLVAARLVFNEFISAWLLAMQVRKRLGFIIRPWMVVFRTLSFGVVVFLAVTLLNEILNSESVLMLVFEVSLSFSCAALISLLFGISYVKDFRVMIRS